MRHPVHTLVLAIALLAVAALAGCGGKSSTSPTAPTVAADVYVSATAGSDIGNGSSAHPFRTLTHALAAADSGVVIHVAPGTYDTTLGEHFPLVMKAGQVLLGDTLARGAGATPTVVFGSGPCPSGYDAIEAAILGNRGAVITGLRIGAPYSPMHFAVVARGAGVTVTCNTFDPPTYGGVQLEGAGHSSVRANTFDCAAYGVRLFFCTDELDVVSNTFGGQTIEMDVIETTGDTRVNGNTFAAGGTTGISVQHGSPRIVQNTFTGAGGWPAYGAITTSFDDATPIVRSNTFVCARGLNVQTGAPDLGTATEAGANSFAGVTGVAVYHQGTATILAIGNTWAHASPTAGVDVIFTSTGHVRWGTGVGQILP